MHPLANDLELLESVYKLYAHTLKVDVVLYTAT